MIDRTDRSTALAMTSGIVVGEGLDEPLARLHVVGAVGKRERRRRREMENPTSLLKLL